MTTDSRVGTTIAGYRIERLLGRGGIGRVYLAEDIRLDRNVALKLRTSGSGTGSPGSLAWQPRSITPTSSPIHEAGEQTGFC